MKALVLAIAILMNAPQPFFICIWAEYFDTYRKDIEGGTALFSGAFYDLHAGIHEAYRHRKHGEQVYCVLVKPCDCWRDGFGRWHIFSLATAQIKPNGPTS